MSPNARSTTPAYDCQACGACCIVAGPVTVSPRDTQVPRYLTASVRRTVGFASFEADEGVRRMASDATGRCRALKGTAGQSCRCGIYDKRPGVCRAFKAGDEGCLEARQRFGIANLKTQSREGHHEHPMA